MVGQVIFLFSLRVTPLSLDQGCLYANPNWHVPLHWVRTKWMQRFWQHLESGWNVYMREYEYYTVLYTHIYIYIRIYKYKYIYIFKHYVYLVYIHPNISCRPFVVYLRFRQQAQHVSRTLLCSQSPETWGFQCAFSGRQGTLGPGWHKLHTPKNWPKRWHTTDLFNIFFFGFTSKTRPWKFCKLLLGSMVFSIRKFSLVSPGGFRMPNFPKDMLELSWQLGMFILPRRTKLPTWGERNGSCVLFLGDGNSWN